MSVENTPTSQQAATPRAPYAILVTVAAMGPVAMNMFIPSMPGLQSHFATTPGIAQLTLSLYFAGLAISQLIYGPLSDRYGRRPVLLAGVALFATASIWCALATSIEELIISRCLQAIGGASGMILSRAIVRDMFSRERSASVLGYITTAWVLAPMISPLIGGLLDQSFSYHASFWLLASYGLVVFLATAFWLPETNPSLQPDAPLIRVRLYATLLRNRAFRGYTATVTFGATVFFVYLATAPFITITLGGHTPVTYGIWIMTVAVGYMLGNFISGRYSVRFGNDRMIAWGNLFTLIGAVLMLGLAVSGNISPAAVFLPMTLCAIGNGLTIPNGITAAISVDPNNVGSGAGLSGFIQMSVGAAASQFVGYQQATWTNTGFWIIAIAALLAFVAHPARHLKRSN